MEERCDCWWGKAYQVLLILKCQKHHSDRNKTQVPISRLENDAVRRCDGKPPQCGYVLLTKGSSKSVAFCGFFKTSLQQQHQKIQTKPQAKTPQVAAGGSVRKDVCVWSPGCPLL